MDANGQRCASIFFNSSINIFGKKQHINTSWNDAILGNAVNTDNDLETTSLQLEKVTNMDSNQNEIKLGESKLVHLGRNWISFVILLRNLVEGLEQVGS